MLTRPIYSSLIIFYFTANGGKRKQYKTQFYFTDRFDVRLHVAPTQLQNFTDLNYDELNSAVLRVVYLPLFVISAQNGKSQMQYEHLFSICLER